MEPLVDVNIAVYNHAPYLERTLEGVLNQKTNFRFRVLVGDDCSTDGSIEILQEYEKKYPDLVEVIYQKKNIGLLSSERNGIILLRKSTAKYIALLDGDDYWIDSFKLQKQVEFLEENPEFAICFHQAKIEYDDEPDRLAYSNSKSQQEVTTFSDLARGEYIYTSTCVFRNGDFRRYPERFNCYLNNYTIDLHNAQFGKIKYMKEVMSVYRVHKGGIWSMTPREITLENQLSTYKFYVRYFDKKYEDIFLNHLRKMTTELIVIKMKNKDSRRFWKYLFDYAKFNFISGSRKRVLFNFLKAVATRIKG
jgi:glycosyltransferase involved in cell wall biosynthesis